MNQSSSASLESQKDSGGKSGGNSERSGVSVCCCGGGGGWEWLSMVARVSQAILRSEEPPAQAETRVSRSTCGILKKEKEACFYFLLRARENWSGSGNDRRFFFI